MTPLSPGGVRITDRWLTDHGWRMLTRQERQPTDHYRLDLGGRLLGGRPFLGATDDLCVEVARVSAQPDEVRWHCWITQVEPRRHIHVRDVQCIWELVALVEGLTGVKWEE